MGQDIGLEECKYFKSAYMMLNNVQWDEESIFETDIRTNPRYTPICDEVFLNWLLIHSFLYVVWAITNIAQKVLFLAYPSVVGRVCIYSILSIENKIEFTSKIRSINMNNNSCLFGHG